MVRYLLNTNHAVALLNADPRITERLTRERADRSEFAVSTVTIGELFYGAYHARKVQENLTRIRSVILPNFLIYAFDVPAAEEFGKIQAELRTKGTPIPVADAQIAAIGRLHSMMSSQAIRTSNW